MFCTRAKKLGKILLSLILSLSIVSSFERKVYSSDEGNIEISAPAAVLMEPKTGKVLYEKNAHEVRCCASITKVMTMTLVMEALDSGKINLTDTVAASEHSSSMGGSDIWLEPGEVMTVDELSKATMVASANDAAVALAEHVCGSEDIFVTEMNRKANELGMADTVFKNCNGLDEDGHVTSAYDVALMSRELIKHKKIFDYTSIWMDYLRDGKTQLVNTNKLLRSYKGITGLKTGTTSQAGSCITATATRGNLSLIAVILGATNGKDRFKDAATLLDFGFANYNMLQPVVDESIFEPVKVLDGMKPEVAVEAHVGAEVLVPKGKEHSIDSSMEIASEVAAPVKKGQSLGRLIYKLNDEIVAEYDIVAAEDVEAINFSAIFKDLLSKFFKT